MKKTEKNVFSNILNKKYKELKVMEQLLSYKWMGIFGQGVELSKVIPRNKIRMESYSKIFFINESTFKCD